MVQEAVTEKYIFFIVLFFVFRKLRFFCVKIFLSFLFRYSAKKWGMMFCLYCQLYYLGPISEVRLRVRESRDAPLNKKAPEGVTRHPGEIRDAVANKFEFRG